MSTGRSTDWSRTARSLENHHLRSRPTQRRNGRTLRFRWADERANLRHIYSTMSGSDARSPRYRHHGQPCGSQGRWRAPGNRSGGRAPAISAAVFAGFQSDRTGLQQSEIEAAQGRRAHSQRTLSQNRLDFPLLQNSRMYKFLQACGVRVNVSGICSSRAGAAGTAIAFAGSGDTFVLDSGATVVGGIKGFNATDTLEFAVAAANGYTTSAGPSGMTALTLTNNGAAVAS